MSAFTSAAALYRALMLAAATAPDDLRACTLADFRPAEEGEPADLVAINLQARAARKARAAGEPLPSLQDGASPMVAVHGPQRSTDDLRLTFAYSTGPGSRSSMRLDGTAPRLRAMADHVRKHWALYGGGPKPAELLRPVKPRTGPTWKPAQLRAWLYMLETREFADALAAGDDLAATFYPGNASSGAPIIICAPVPIDGLPDGFVTGLRDDGKWSAYHLASGHSIIRGSAGAGSRARAEALAREYTEETAAQRGLTVAALLESAAAKAQAADTAAARAAWCKLRGIEDPAAPADVDTCEAPADAAAPELAAPVVDPAAAAPAPAAAPAARPAPVSALLGGARFSTAILRHPSGRFGIVGSVPVALSVAYGGAFPGRRSMTWDTEGEAVAALLAAGVERFQLADCSWHAAPAPVPPAPPAPVNPGPAADTCGPARAAALALRRLTLDAAPCAGRADAICAGLADDAAALPELARRLDAIRRGGPPVDRAEAGRALAALQAAAAPTPAPAATDPGPGGQAAPVDAPAAPTDAAAHAEACHLAAAALQRFGSSDLAACRHLAAFPAWHLQTLRDYRAGVLADARAAWALSHAEGVGARLRAAAAALREVSPFNPPAAPDPAPDAGQAAPMADPAPWRGPENAAARARVHAVHVRTAAAAQAQAPGWHAGGLQLRRSVNAAGFDPASLDLRRRLAAALRADRAAARRAAGGPAPGPVPCADPAPAPASSAAIVGHLAPAAECCADATVSGSAGPVFVPPPPPYDGNRQVAAAADDAALPWQILAAQPGAVYATPVRRIGVHEWCTVVYAHPLYVACTDHLWRRVDQNAGAFKRSRDWPTYDSNRGHGGMPTTLAKLYAAHQDQIQQALDDVRALRLPTWCAGHVMESARQGLAAEAQRAASLARLTAPKGAGLHPPARAAAQAPAAPAAPVHPPAPDVATSAQPRPRGVAVCDDAAAPAAAPAACTLKPDRAKPAAAIPPGHRLGFGIGKRPRYPGRMPALVLPAAPWARTWTARQGWPPSGPPMRRVHTPTRGIATFKHPAPGHRGEGAC